MSKTLPPHGNAKYPWPLWDDGKVHTVRRGRHFHVPPSSFRNQVIGYALRHGKKADTRVVGDKVVFSISEQIEGESQN